MNKPLDPLPERELCKYEKIREEIIRERMEAMNKCNFFKDLNEMKSEMGITREVNEEREVKNKTKKKKKAKKSLVKHKSHEKSEEHQQHKMTVKAKDSKEGGTMNDDHKSKTKSIDQFEGPYVCEVGIEQMPTYDWDTNFNRVYGNTFVNDEWNYFELLDIM